MKLLKIILAAAVIIASFKNASAQSFLTNGLVAYYPFNGNANDVSGNGNNGTVHNAVLAADRFGNPNACYAFNGRDSYITVPNNRAISSFAGAMTVSCWFTLVDKPSNYQWLGIVSKAAATTIGGGSGFEIRTHFVESDNNRCANGQGYILGEDAHFKQSWNFNGATWYHCVAVSSGNETLLYLNGQPVSRGSNSGNFNNREPLTIGGQNGAFDGRLHAGKIEDVRIYNRALSAVEVAQLYNAERTGNVATVVAGNSGNAAPTEISIPQKIADVAKQLAPPTNEIAELSGVTGEIRVLDAKGVLMQTNFTYLPRIPLADLQNSDCLELLENKMAYATLTSFGNPRYRTAQSEQFEKQMRQMWLHGEKLQEKIQTRLVLLNAILGYNSAATSFASAARTAQQSGAAANAMANAADNYSAAASAAEGQYNQVKGQVEYEKTYAVRPQTTIIDEVYAAHDVYKAQNAQAQTANSATALANQAAAAGQQAANASERARIIAMFLAKYGIVVSDTPPFTPIPALTMRLEVDMERVAKQ